MAEQKAITEREVRRLAREGAKVIDIRGAIVTPGARTAAKELGILLSGPEAPTSMVPMRAYGSTEARLTPKTTIALAADAAGGAIRDVVATRLYELEHTVQDLTKGDKSPRDAVDAAVAVAREVAAGSVAVGIIVDGTGIAACMAANKVKGVRAALCHDVTSAVSARQHCDANVLCLGGSLIGPRLATAIVETFLAREFVPARYANRLAKLKAVDDGR